ncbi:hypothetical protein L6452_09273 [Arctium lappa]|uniref:Uncharacterized protein n=1 Tax=Arctium lappa TaxID=4217 RepID=A0ACB9DKK7_ARCLA|nr:hypothetical protein L6452_09273 [Arctium lappa]
MDSSSDSVLVSKVPMLKPNEFDMWKIRIKQYILLTDFSMWDIIENGPSDGGKMDAEGKRPPSKTDGKGKLRFSGTKSTKRNQKAILKQQYENFMSTKNESMTQTFDRFNKLIGELATVGVQIDQDDVNRKFLRSLGDEWTMYTVSFRQNNQLEDKELDDLYNDLRVFEAEVEAKKRTYGYSYNAALLSSSTDSSQSGMPQQHTSNHQPSQSSSFNSRNSSQALVSQEGMGFDWSDQAEEAVQNQTLMAKVSESASTDIPTEVTSNICSKTCIEIVKKYRDHNQCMCDDLKRLEKDRREYVLIIERFEEQIKCYQANELQHSYDTNYWKWEKSQLEVKLKKSEEECEKIRSDFEKAKLDIEKYSNASKEMDSLLKAQDKKELPERATEVDPLDKVVVEADSEEEDSESKNEEDHKDIPLENHILTNERGGKPFVKSEKMKSVEETVKNEKAETPKRGKEKQIKNHMAVSSAPVKSHAQSKFANSKKNTPNKPRSNLKTKKANNFVQVWVPRVKKSVSTATSNSTADRNNVVASNTTANPVSTTNDVSTANKVSTANQVSTASSDRPIILTKYSSNKIPQFDNLIKSEYEYVDENGKPKTTLAWVPIKN